MKRPMVRGRIVVGLMAGVLLTSLVPYAQADDAPAKPAAAPATPAAAPAKPPALTGAELTAAKKHYAEGEKKYKAADFEGSLAEFKQANEVKSTPQAERFIGLCEDALGHYPEAVDWYDKFLAHVPDKMASAADDLKKREIEIKAMPGKVHVESTPPGAGVAVDDKPAVGSTPTDIELATGSHKLALSAPGHLPTEKTVDVTYASTQTVTAELEPEPPPPPPPPPPVVAAVPPPAPVAPALPAEQRSRLPAFITGGIAVAAMGVGTVFGVIALNDKSNFDKNPTTQTADDGDTHSLIADMAFGIGVTFGVTSAVLFLTKDEPPATSANATAHRAGAAPEKKSLRWVATPIVGPHMGGGGFLMQF